MITASEVSKKPGAVHRDAGPGGTHTRERGGGVTKVVITFAA